MSSHLKDRIYAEQITDLFRHTYTITLSHPIAGGILAANFWGSVDSAWILSWLTALVIVSFMRLPAYMLFKRADKKLTDYPKWGNVFYLVSILQGSLYSIAFVTLIFHTESHLHNYVLIWMIGLTACSVVGYASNIKGLMCFFVPCILPGIISLLIADGSSNIWMALAVIVYSAVIIKTVIPVHKSIVNAMRLNYTLESEIETRKIVEEKLHKLSIEDALTGAFNRRYFDSSLTNEINRARRSNHPLCLVLIDIDQFKQYNDFYGHQQGDECLQNVVKVLQQSLQRSGDILARYGGEEFAIILPHMNQLEANALTDALRHALEVKNLEHQKSSVENVSFVTISAGIAQYTPESEGTPETLIQQADKALYAAKSAGRNQVSCFGDS